jgi:hypothetical protein
MVQVVVLIRSVLGAGGAERMVRSLFELLNSDDREIVQRATTHRACSTPFVSSTPLLTKRCYYAPIRNNCE